MEFIKEMVITGIEQCVSKNGNTYVLIHILLENGQTVACMYRSEDPLDLGSIKKMEKNKILFYLVVGRYTQLYVKKVG